MLFLDVGTLQVMGTLPNVPGAPGIGIKTAALLIERVLAILVAAVAVQVFFDGLFEILRAEGILS